MSWHIFCDIYLIPGTISIASYCCSCCNSARSNHTRIRPTCNQISQFTQHIFAAVIKSLSKFELVYKYLMFSSTVNTIYCNISNVKSTVFRTWCDFQTAVAFLIAIFSLLYCICYTSLCPWLKYLAHCYTCRHTHIHPFVCFCGVCFGCFL